MASFGEKLKQERELRDISLREISEATKISVRYLEALEQNRFERLPGGVFNKGFIRAYARYIGVDDQAMVDHYMEETVARARAPGSPVAGAPASVHRPARIPTRRAGPQNGTGVAPGPAAPHPRTDPPVPAIAPAATEVARAVQAICAARGSARAPASPGALPRIAWLIVGTALLFIALSVAAHRMAPRWLDDHAAVSVPVDDDLVAPRKRTAEPDTPPDRLETQGVTGAAAGADASKPRPMNLRLEARAAGFVRVSCDMREELNRVMRPGEVVTLSCMSPIRISADDAGAIHLSVDGAPCAPLGSPGQRLFGFSIRRDTLPTLCPTSSGETNGRT